LPEELSESFISILAKRYFDEKSKMINGKKFIRDVESFGKVETEPESSAQNESPLKRLKLILQSKQLNAMNVFRSFDCGRNGFVNRDRLNCIFRSLGFEMSENEERELWRQFSGQRMADQLNYVKLLKALEDEEVHREDLGSVSVKLRGMDQELANSLNSIRSKLAARRKRADSVFADLEGDLLPMSEFRRRLENYGLIIEKVDRIVKMYRANLRGDVDWKSFCRDVDSIGVVKSRDEW
jgi:Ca2+-binding EF-hand superfamily protein